jgi:hypothetical protein
MDLEAPEALGGLLHGGTRQRGAIEAGARVHVAVQTRRTVPMRFSMMLVQAMEPHSSAGRPSRVTVSNLVEPFKDRSGNALPVFFETPGESAKQLFGLAASSISQAWRRTRRTCAFID